MFGYVYIVVVGLSSYILVTNILRDYDNVNEDIRFGLSCVPPLALWRGLMYLIDEGKLSLDS